jgi:hypothetical protein
VRLAPIEKETLINCNAGEAVAYVHSREPRVWRHFARIGVSPTVEHRDASGQLYARDYEVPKPWVRFPKPPKKMNLTPEQRQAAAERMRRARAGR